MHINVQKPTGLLVLLLLCGCFLSQTARAATVHLQGDNPVYRLDSATHYWIDPGQDATIYDAKETLREGKWTTIGDDSISFGFTRAAYWYHVTLVNSTNEIQRKLFEITYPALNHIHIYAFSESEVVLEQKLGDRLPYSERAFDNESYIVPLHFDPNQTIEIFFRVQTSSAMQFNLNLWEHQSFTEQLENRTIIMGFYYGAMLVMALYNLLIFISIRDLNYFYYVCYVISISTLLFCLNGFSFKYLWPNQVAWNEISTALTLACAGIFSCIFTRNFLKIRESRPALSMALLTITYAGVIAAIAAFVLPYSSAIYLALTTVFLTIFCCLYAGYIRWFDGYRPARYYAVAWTCTLVGGLINALSKFGLLDLNFFTHYSAHIGSGLEVILLSLALADRINTERILRENTQSELLSAQSYALDNLKHYQKLYDSAAQGLFALDAEGYVIRANPSFARLVGAPLEELNISQEESKTPPWNISDFIRGLTNLDSLSSEKEIHKEQGTNAQGNNFWCNIKLNRTSPAETTLSEADGEVQYNGSLTDITASVAFESAQREKDAAEAAAKAKSQFFASMSHELRTPLTAVLGYAEIAKNPAIEDEKRLDAAATIERSGNHLLQLINDILDLSKIEAQKLTVEKLPTSPIDIISDISDNFSILAGNKGVLFHTNFIFPLPETFDTDPTRLKQVLINLCGNALKFTEQGSVTLSVSWNQQLNRILFTIQDTGIGMKPEQLKKLFGAFMQADSSTTRKFGGTGLGLHLSKQIAEKLGGDILVDSEYGKGSTFTVYIDSGSCQGKIINSLPKKLTPEALPPPPKLNGSVLYAEDNQQNQLLVKDIVERTGCILQLANTGEEAWQFARQGTYDLIMSDVRMPEMDGLELCQRIREIKPELPMIAITAEDSEELNQQLLSVGYREILKKPVSNAEIYQSLARHIKQSITEENERPPAVPLRLMVAEDNQINQKLLEALLKRLAPDMEIEFANDGLEALAKALTSTFDLIFMDVEMPYLDGLKASALIREKNINTPIYALTAHEDTGDNAQYMEAGCQGVLFKPFNANKIKAVLEAVRDTVSDTSQATESR